MTKVYKNSQFKAKVIVFIIIFKLINIKLSQISQLLFISLYLSNLNVYNLSDKRVLLINKRGLLIDEGILIYILSSKSIIIRNLRLKYTLVYNIDLKVTLTRNLSLIK